MRIPAALSCAALLGSLGLAHSQEPPFPQRGPIEITVLFPAGSSADVTARLLADGMARQLGTNVLVVNRPGAGGAIGYRYVAAQKPDGYSLVWNSNSISTTYHSGTLAFDYQSFEAVAQVLVESPVLAVRGDSKWRTLADLIVDAKSKPKGVTIANSGVGSHTHISSVALFKAAGVAQGPAHLGQRRSPQADAASLRDDEGRDHQLHRRPRAAARRAGNPGEFGASRAGLDAADPVDDGRLGAAVRGSRVRR